MRFIEQVFLTFFLRYERKIKSYNGLDLAIVGIGRTGHIGFNEPGSQLNDRTRVVILNNTTRMTFFFQISNMYRC